MTEAGTETRRVRPDWERIEIDYRAGQMSVREVARANGCTEAAIRKHARKHGWTRDLSVKIDLRARAMAIEASVRGDSSHGSHPAYQSNEEDIIAAGAANKAEVLIRQERAITENGRVIDSIRADIVLLEGDRDAMICLRDRVSLDLLLAIPGDDAEAAKRRDARLAAFDRLVAVPNRLRMARELMELEKLRIDLEAKVYHLSDDPALNDYPAGLDLFYPADAPVPEKPGLVDEAPTNPMRLN